MERVLITGASGFIGRKTVEAALRQEEWQVHAAVGKNDSGFPAGVTVHKADLSDESSCRRLIGEVKPDIIIHLAWALAERDYSQSVSNLIWLENSLRLLRCFFENSGRRFVFVGSASEYGEPGGRHTEATVPVDRTVYGASKAAFEQICTNYCQKHQLEFVSARCFPVYGEGDGRAFKAISAAIDTFLKGEPFVCKGPNNVWDYIHVDDVAGALVKIADSGYCGVVNVGTGTCHTMREVFRDIAEKMGCTQLLSFEENTKSVTIQVADPKVLNEQIGYKCNIDLSDGLDRTIAWWKTHTTKEI